MFAYYKEDTFEDHEDTFEDHEDTIEDHSMVFKIWRL